MLAIKKRYKSLRALSAGSIAFAIGLSGAAAYVGSNLVHQNLTSNKEQTTTSPAETTPPNNTGAVTIDSTDQQGTVLYDQPQPASAEPVVTTAPSAPPVAAPTVTTDPATSPSAPTGSSSSPTPTPTPPAPTTPCSELVLPLVPVPGVNCILS